METVLNVGIRTLSMLQNQVYLLLISFDQFYVVWMSKNITFRLAFKDRTCKKSILSEAIVQTNNVLHLLRDLCFVLEQIRSDKYYSFTEDIVCIMWMWNLLDSCMQAITHVTKITFGTTKTQMSGTKLFLQEMFHLLSILFCIFYCRWYWGQKWVGE